MEKQLKEELNSMMQSVSRNIGQYDLTPEPLFVGQYSQIFHIKNRQDHKSHVLKVIPRRSVKKSESQIKKVYSRQKKIHQSLKNRYLVQLLNAFHDQNSYFLVMQYCSTGNLRNIMETPMSVELVKDYGLQIAKGIFYLHKNKIIHGDLTPQNILINHQNSIKICDFGQSSKFQQRIKQKCVGSFLYAPPQAIQIFDVYRDIWALGCILYEMLVGSHPFPVKNWKQLSLKLNEDFLKKFKCDQSMSPSFANLIKKIFTYDKMNRLNIQQIINHQFFTNEPLQMSIAIQKCQQKVPKKRSTHKSKVVFKSVELGQRNKQNNINSNNPSKNTQNKVPDYRKILDKKFKQHFSKEISRQASVDRQKKNLIASDSLTQQLKKMRTTKTISTTSNLNYNVKRNVFQPAKIVHLQPLNTEGMVIKEIIKNNNKILIDKNGFRRYNQNNEMHVSCDGRIIVFKKNQTQKLYKLEELPQKYHQKYQECKKIVNQTKTCTPRLTYKDKEYDLSIMYDGSVHVIFTDGRVYKSENPIAQSNSKQISANELLLIKNVYMMYKSLVQLSKAN